MNVLAARSHNEAAVFVLLRDCRACGKGNRDLTDTLEVTDDGVFAEHTAFCRECTNIDVYRFALPKTDPQAGVRGVVFGGPKPSSLLDAGEWLVLSNNLAEGAPSEPDGLTDQQRSDAAMAVQTAAAAVREVVKFIEAGRERLAYSALWTDAGREEFDRDPWRFSRPRLAVIEKAYLDVAERLAGGRPIW
jgi:hypothetical protein